MANLGSIVVIKNKCLFCGKPVETEESFDIVFCSVLCWEWYQTLCKELNGLYGWSEDGKRTREEEKI